jgi:site-specific DNA recombinase
MIAAIYARKSTEQNGVQDIEKSVTRQIASAKAYATAKGWTVDDRYVFSDDGISGAEFSKRPGFLRLMNALKPARFHRLIMSDLDRLGRDTIQTPYAIQQLLDAGVAIYTYLNDREVTMEGATDTFLVQVQAFVASLEREKARQRTSDAMTRKAKAGHVTGGRTFGYTNVRIDKGPVERIINEEEAAVVRRIFDLCAKGFGQVAIAKKLNEAGAPAPRAQQGRPTAWAPSSVREVLHRDLYRGLIVWNRTKKRDARGQIKPSPRPEADWVTVPAPKLRIVSDAQWSAAHSRLTRTRETYLRATGGRLWGKPHDGMVGKYLLTGFARCGRCGGSLEVRTRGVGKDKPRQFFYACSSYWKRGKSVCGNSLELPMVAADAAVLDAVERDLLTPAFVDSVVRKLLTRASLTGSTLEETRGKLTTQLSEVRQEIDRLVLALATVGTSPSVTMALKDRETRQKNLEQELAALEHRDQFSHVDVSRLETAARLKVTEWSGLMRRHQPQARQILDKVLKEKLRFTPECRGSRKGYKFEGAGTLTKLLTGGVPGFSLAVASPAGIKPYRPAVGGLVLRRVA